MVVSKFLKEKEKKIKEPIIKKHRSEWIRDLENFGEVSFGPNKVEERYQAKWKKIFDRQSAEKEVEAKKIRYQNYLILKKEFEPESF
jgi:hypothetical protein